MIVDSCFSSASFDSEYSCKINIYEMSFKGSELSEDDFYEAGFRDGRVKALDPNPNGLNQGTITYINLI